MYRLQHLYSVVAIIILTAAIYANTLKNGFVYDDRALTIVSNPGIKDLHNLPKLLTEEYFKISNEKTYRPVVTLTYFLDYAMFGLRPWGYHLTNILLHAINGGLLYLFLTLLFKNTPDHPSSPIHYPLIISLLFAAHPALTEAVNGISYREDLLAFLFYVATLVIYIALRGRSSLCIALWYLLSLITYFLSLLSKEMAVTLPLIVYCYEYIYGRKKEKGLFSILPNRYNTGYIAITLIYILYKPVSGGSLFHGLIERGASIPWLIISYVKLLLFPVVLSADYVVVPINSYSSPLFILPFLAVISLAAAIFMMRKGEKGVLFGFLFFVITLAPVYNIVSMDNFIAERYLYLPAAGFAVLAGAVISAIISDLKSKFLYLLITVFAVAGLYSFAVIRRNSVWENEYLLWSDTVRKMPESARAHFGMGYAWFEQGRVEEAIREYKTVVMLSPTYTDAYNNLGYLYAYQGRFEEAVPQLEAALRLKPHHPDAHDNLGKIYTIQGRFDEAVRHFNEALNVKADDPAIRTRLGFAYYRQGRIEEARAEFEITLRQQPDHMEARRLLESLN